MRAPRLAPAFGLGVANRQNQETSRRNHAFTCFLHEMTALTSRKTKRNIVNIAVESERSGRKIKKRLEIQNFNWFSDFVVYWFLTCVLYWPASELCQSAPVLCSVLASQGRYRFRTSRYRFETRRYRFQSAWIQIQAGADIVDMTKTEEIIKVFRWNLHNTHSYLWTFRNNQQTTKTLFKTLK